MPVKQLNLSDFQKGFKSIKNPCNLHGLIMFYQNTCPHCEVAKPIVKNIGKNKNVAIFLTECSGKNFDILEGLKIEGVPAIRYITPKGKISNNNYDNKITDLKLKKFLLSKVKK